MKRWKRPLIAAVGLVMLAYAGACGYFWSNQVELIFLPLRDIDSTPAIAENVSIPVGNGPEQEELHGFWVKTNPEAPAVLYLHGQDATMTKNFDHVERLHELGYNVLLIDYRGFGRSYGTTEPSETSVYEDAEAAWNYLTGDNKDIGEKGFAEERTFIYGHSLGGAIAIELATRQPDAAGLITECTFTCVEDVARLQYNGCLGLLPLESILDHRFESLDKIGTLEIPVLLIHGTADTKVPCCMAVDLYSAAPESTELLLIKGGGHANSGSEGAEKYTETVSDFVEQHARKLDQDAQDQGIDVQTER